MGDDSRSLTETSQAQQDKDCTEKSTDELEVKKCIDDEGPIISEDHPLIKNTNAENCESNVTNSNKNGPENDPNSNKNDPENDPSSNENDTNSNKIGTENDPNSNKNGLENDPNSNKNGFENDPNSNKNGLENDPNSNKNGLENDPNSNKIGAKNDPNSNKNDTQNDPNSNKNEPENDPNPLSTVQRLRNKCIEQLGFELAELLTWEKFVKMLYRPADPISLALSRVLFGFLMMIDIPDERGLGEADLRWGDPDDCRFPLFDILGVLPLHWMCIVYFVMWLGSLGIMLGAYFKISCIMFLIPYWYIFLLDKTAWNNHSYLYGILGFLFLATDSHYAWSFDAWRGKVKPNRHIPLWNYALMRFQLFLLYFYAGLKKTEFDWLAGHSMQELSRHWVFHPWKIFFTPEQIDLWIVHLFGFLLDLTVGFGLYFDYTRSSSFLLLVCFHIMNSQLFHIGMFPFVCLATMHLFCYPDWPRKIIFKFERFRYLVDQPTEKNPTCFYKEESNENRACITRRQSLSVILILIHAVLQMFLPYSHFITKGYNNWTNGLYGYSWDMMVHTWDTSLVTVKVVNLKNNETMFIDPEAWVRNNKWQRHADMVVQYAECVSRNLEKLDKMKNISIYLDVWVSLNKRFHQRMYNPHVDILKAEWSPFQKVTWLMPLITKFDQWRPTLYKLEKDVHSWSKSTSVLFMADFPGYSIQNYIHGDISNVTLKILEGRISIKVEGEKAVNLSAGSSTRLMSPKFHEIHTVSDSPSAFMYTFNNLTKIMEGNFYEEVPQSNIFQWIESKIENYINSIALVSNSFLRILYSIPMVRRIRIHDPDDDE